jgi:hypothetical protein
VQGFSGYGQSLIDYNYSQKSLGAGFLVDFNGRAAQDARRQQTMARSSSNTPSTPMPIRRNGR